MAFPAPLYIDIFLVYAGLIAVSIWVMRHRKMGRILKAMVLSFTVTQLLFYIDAMFFRTGISAIIWSPPFLVPEYWAFMGTCPIVYIPRKIVAVTLWAMIKAIPPTDRPRSAIFLPVIP